MVLDTSALLAILFLEPEADRFADLIASDPRRLLSAASMQETAIVVEARKGPSAGRELDLLIHRARIDVVAFEESQLELARQAWRRFGKGNHRANLNFGDCFAYALSRSSGEPLLFKGGDFAQTDVARVA
jgi:ribonuclease VapC